MTDRHCVPADAAVRDSKIRPPATFLRLIRPQPESPAHRMQREAGLPLAWRCEVRPHSTVQRGGRAPTPGISWARWRIGLTASGSENRPPATFLRQIRPKPEFPAHRMQREAGLLLAWRREVGSHTTVRRDGRALTRGGSSARQRIGLTARASENRPPATFLRQTCPKPEFLAHRMQRKAGLPFAWKWGSQLAEHGSLRRPGTEARRVVGAVRGWYRSERFGEPASRYIFRVELSETGVSRRKSAAGGRIRPSLGPSTANRVPHRAEQPEPQCGTCVATRWRVSIWARPGTCSATGRHCTEAQVSNRSPNGITAGGGPSRRNDEHVLGHTEPLVQRQNSTGRRHR